MCTVNIVTWVCIGNVSCAFQHYRKQQVEHGDEP